MARASLPFLVVVAMAVFIVTYNTVTMLMSYQKSSAIPALQGMDEVDDGRNFFNPLVKMPDNVKRGPKRLFHVAVTANDSPYNRWQTRIMYYWYKKFKDDPLSEMGGFTRILHSGKPDNVMDEIPTVVVDPLPEGEDRGYVVLNRPWAFVQWLRKANIEEDYIMMAEPDHVFIKPLPNLASELMPAAFPFFYIEPKKNEAVLRKFYPEEKGPITNIDPIGNSPVIIQKAYLEKIAPTWANVSINMKDDPEADTTFGWVLEMYGYATASALHDVQHILVKDFMLQPPWDTELGDKYIIHYTYGCDYNMQGKLTYGTIGEWRFDKRSFTTGAPPKNLPMPPLGVPETVVTLVRMVNEATANIPNWKEGE
ncbi:unnamed protein product [Sphagnum jensenii]|uniref:Hydroxyproline O-arabinosyltransferase-like domain-containing protein n=1 Tax=Sphagnum jensenii TaxID=128206 RepID=A0ABP0WUQ0_9BRYO